MIQSSMLINLCQSQQGNRTSNRIPNNPNTESVRNTGLDRRCVDTAVRNHPGHNGHRGNTNNPRS